MFETRSPHVLRLRSCRLLGVGIAILSTSLGTAAPGRAADPGQARAPAVPISPIPSVAVEEGKLTVDLHHVELGFVLREIAARAAFDLRTSGQLGRVTAVFAGLPLEEGLRRLALEHELVFVYRAMADGAEPALVEVRVFGGSPPNDPRRVAADLAEINRVLRRGGGPEGAARLAGLLGTAADPVVRTRAAAALGRIGGAGAAAALMGALTDQAAQVRAQAVDALRRVAGARALPALGGLLLRDPDATVRRAAARALGMLRGTPATSALAAASADSDVSVRREVIRALRRHGVVVP